MTTDVFSRRPVGISAVPGIRGRTWPVHGACGFTLIELMIVIAIIGILGTMALANYTTIFVARSHISEGVTLAAGMKPGVAEAANGFGTLTGITTGVYQGLPAVATDVKGKYVSQVAVVDGVITATLGGDASAVVAGKRLVLTPTLRAGSVAWICSSDADSKYLPATCRP